MAGATAADYAWFQDHWLREAFCITLVRGLDEREVLGRFGGERSRPRTLTAAAAGELSGSFQAGYPQIVLVTKADGWAVAVEDNGWEGSRPEVLRALSGGTQAVSVYRNVNALGYFSDAVDGQLLVQFEPLFPQRRWGSRPDLLLPQMRAVGLDPDRDEPPPMVTSTRRRWPWPSGSPASTWRPRCWTARCSALRSPRCWPTPRRRSPCPNRTRSSARRSRRPRRRLDGRRRPPRPARRSSSRGSTMTRWWPRRWPPPRPGRPSRSATTRRWAGASAPGRWRRRSLAAQAVRAALFADPRTAVSATLEQLRYLPGDSWAGIRASALARLRRRDAPAAGR